MNTTEVPPPQLPARYRAVVPLGGGGMSQVWLAEDRDLGGKTVVVKVIGARLAERADYRERFRREQRVVREFDHPNIIGLLGYGDGDPLFLAMPHVDGGSLLDQLRRVGRLSLAGTLRIAGQVASALDYAHEQGVVHRDVKPGNILLHSRTDHVYLCDFGVAMEAGGAELTGGAGYVGTPGYLAPECYGTQAVRLYAGADSELLHWLEARPPGRAGDARVDVYGLAAVIHYCLTGQPAFDPTHELVRAQLTTDPPPLTAARPELPPAVAHVLHTALSRNPDHRPPTCAALVEALTAAAATPAPEPRRSLAHRAAGLGRRISVLPSRPAIPADGTAPAGGIAMPVGRTGRRRVMIGVVVGVAALAVVAVVGVWALGGAGDGSARVPGALRGHCAGADRAGGLPGADGVVECSVGARRVRVSLFGSGSATDAAYARVVRGAGAATGSGDCTGASGPPGGAGNSGAEHRYPVTGTAAGRVVCWSRAGTTTFAWSDDGARAVAEVSAHTAGAAGLAADWGRWVGLPAFPSAGDRELAGQVVLSGCRRPAGGELDDLTGVTAAVRCDAPGSGAGSVSYYRFGSVAELRRAQRGRVAAAGAPDGVDCGDGSAPGFLGDHPLDLRSVVIGDLLCHPDTRHAPVLEWTVEPLRLMGVATGSTAAALAGWWRGYFGYAPPGSAIAAAVDRQASPAFPTAVERALLDHVPAASRVDCMRPSADQVRDNVGRVPVTAVVCGPTRGAGIVFYYQFTDAASMNAAYTRNNDISGPDCTTRPADFHGDAPYSRGGRTGRLGCARTTAGTLDLVWTDSGLEVLGMAFAATDATLLLDWWRWDAGPTG